MKKFVLWLLALLIVGAIGAYVFYKHYLPGMVAEALVGPEEPAYMPKFVKARLQKYREPINQGAVDVIREIHTSNVTLEQILQAIDNTEEDQVYALLDELNRTELRSPDQVFDIGQKYLTADFDTEVLRRPFLQNVNMEMIRTGLKNANYYKDEQGVDPEMAKSVAKQILIQKEREYNRMMKQ